MCLVIGLSGGIGSGKSTVSQILRLKGVSIVDCDEISQAVTKKGCWGWQRVVAAFGKDILLDNGELNRESLGQIVFGNTELRRELNRATHLPIAMELIKQVLWLLVTCHRPVVIDMPLLFESGFNKYTSYNMVVWCTKETQIQRLQQRNGLSQQEALERIEAQLSLDTKKEMADFVFDNSSTVESLQQQIDTWLETYLGVRK